MRAQAAELKAQGTAAFNAGHHAQAQSLWERAAAAYPDDETLWSNLSAARRTLGNPQAALVLSLPKCRTPTLAICQKLNQTNPPTR